uniref:Integrase core domain containing protein n=1 Tax=Solanum tuberosum TaxID=4113 RepID=M1DWG7_SOLTU
MARLITEEHRVLTRSLHTVPEIHRLFQRHKCEWMAREPGTYSEEIVREFYDSYAATLQGSIHKNDRHTAQAPLTATLDIVWGGKFQRSAEKREILLHWLSSQIATDEERAEWVTTPGVSIKKATLTFVAKFFWLLVGNQISSTKAYNALTCDRAVMVAALVAGFEINFACMLIAEIHERVFKASTTYPFPCLIFQLCRDSEVPIWHFDKLIRPTGTLDIGLIQNEENVAAPLREPQVDVPPMGADLVDVVEHMQGDDPAPPTHTNDVPASSSQAASRDPSSSRSSPT